MTIPNRSRATAFGILEGEREESGAYPIGSGTDLSEQLESDAVIAELAPELVSLIPEPPPESMRPRAATPSERAELVFEDLSLSLDNPYLASSLVPPPKRPFPMQRALAIAGGMLAAAGLGAALQFSALRGAPEVSVQKSQSSAGITAPAPVAVASPRELIAPPAALVAPPPVAVAVVSPAPGAEVAAPAVAAQLPVEAPVRAPAPSATIKPKEAPPAPAEPTAVAAPMPARPVAVAPVEEAAAPVAPVEEAAAPVAVNLAAYPTREQVTAGFETVRAALSQCAAGRTGTAEIKATINSNGRIGHALVAGDFRGTTEGSCMAKVVRDAQFPAFAEPRLKVSYPFAL
jgi:hypothetical protein